MISRSQLKREAKEALKPHHWIAVGVSVVASLIIGVLSGTFVGALFAPMLSFGVCSFYMNLVANNQAKFENLFTDTFSNFLKKWGAVWLVALYTALWSLLFYIPGLVKSYSYAMTYYIMLDHPEMGINEAITESRRMMDGYKWKLFVLDLSFIGWHLLCMIPVVGTLIGILYVTPYKATTRAAFYEELKAVNG
ncbi:MAG: DUF975 family protein [Clostridia bacterium]|nr:DUF975 family protein [Clostridia bacterium]